MIPDHLKATLTLTVLVLVGVFALAADHPKPPKFLRAPHILSEQDELWVELQIEPHPDIRAVVLELWEADVDEEVGRWSRGAFTNRGSVEPVNEGNQNQRTFRFRWHSVPAGCYLLVGKVTEARGITRETESRLEVR